MRKTFKKKAENIYSSEAGFTLLELIVSMTILSMVAVLIAYSLHLGIDAWQRGERETGETQRLRVLSGILYQQIKSAYPYEVKIDDEKVVFFKGKPDSLMFVTTLTDSSYGGFKWVRYSFKDGTLLYKEGLLPDKELDDKTGGKEKIVDTDLEKVKFSYFSLNDSEWNDSWDLGEDLPAAVKVAISYFQPFTINIPLGSEKKEDGNEKEV